MMTELEADKKPSQPFPKYVVFILSNEFCERFAFYGIRVALILYLTYFIKFDENTSTVIYHAFTVLAYFFPLLGAAVADGYWGKYKTIKTISIVYAIGMLFFTVSTLPQINSSSDDGIKINNAVIACVGLFIIAFGTGGIKPSVPSFGGDQIESDDVKNTTLFFDLFYIAVNLGSLVGMLLTPLIRTLNCGALGTEDTCWFLAYLIPALLMCIAVFTFLFGTRFYKILPPTGINIFWECTKCIFYGMIKKIPEDAPEEYKINGKNHHWLYGAYGKVDEWVIRDTKYLIKILVVFIPLPIFWSAFDQQGSRWTLQCVRMNGYITDSIHILPDLTQLLNAIFNLGLIPSFNYLYRVIDKNVVRLTSLRKIGLGILFAALAFSVSALVQNEIDVMLTRLPTISSEMSLRVLNMNNGKTISGAFQSKNLTEFPLSDELLPYPNGKIYENVININPGEGSQKFQCQHDIFDETCLNGHSSSAEVIMKTVKGTNIYSFAYTSDEFENENHDVKNYRSFFEINQGQVVHNLAIFGNGNHLTYPGYSSKDPDGRNYVTIISSLDISIFVVFTCLEGPCLDDKTSYEDIVIQACKFHQNGTYIKNQTEVDRPFTCIVGENLNDKDAIKLAKGNFLVEIYDSQSREILKTLNLEVDNGAAHTLTVQNSQKTNEVMVSNIQDINSRASLCTIQHNTTVLRNCVL